MRAGKSGEYLRPADDFDRIPYHDFSAFQHDENHEDSSELSFCSECVREREEVAAAARMKHSLPVERIMMDAGNESSVHDDHGESDSCSECERERAERRRINNSNTNLIGGINSPIDLFNRSPKGSAQPSSRLNNINKPSSPTGSYNPLRDMMNNNDSNNDIGRIEAKMRLQNLGAGGGGTLFEGGEVEDKDATEKVKAHRRISIF